MLRAVTLGFALALACATARAEVIVRSTHAIVIDEATGEVLLHKDESTAAPIASLTKLLTAMVVIDALQDADEELRITEADRDLLKRTRGGVPIGAVASRGALIELAVIASDNRAAAALARCYPGGMVGFGAAMRRKIAALGLADTLIEDPTGLSPDNRSSAQDMIKVLRAAAAYEAITRATSLRTHAVIVNGRPWIVRNTNALVGSHGWTILLSKTGFTNEAGHCLAMRVQTGGRTVVVVLMGAARRSVSRRDALNIRRWIAAGSASLMAKPGATTHLRPASAGGTS